jgi:hypothetical protein
VASLFSIDLLSIAGGAGFDMLAMASTMKAVILSASTLNATGTPDLATRFSCLRDGRFAVVAGA